MVFVPFSDDNPRLVVRYPYVSWTLIAAILAIFFLFQTGYVLNISPQDFMLGFGMIPAVLFGLAAVPPDILSAPPPATLVTSLFLHGDLFHLFGNLFFIFVLADNIEDSMGHLRFVLFWLLCGIAGAGAHALAMPLSEAPLI